ncbi:MAG: hypothetical protein DRR16_08510 [Candidatus Parabeggiatoa sp. nov. 3]|nr:MAG: hypothetical protein DRR00_13605 [Gammaproteobacteria bacterium]RKZ66407.1 MAG: hypothetical protein DRQ99_09785 [Gammaproteobacteria bacterium]RKZ86923.1 MAG: hypothetical protein DRR16_08510 [Gammaproteobacteria bacterium]
MDAINETSLTITLRNVLPHETIGDLIKRACLQGRKFKVSITVEEPIIDSKQAKSIHSLADYLDNHHPFSGLSEQMNRATREIREEMSETLFEKFAK